MVHTALSLLLRLSCLRRVSRELFSRSLPIFFVCSFLLLRLPHMFDAFFQTQMIEECLQHSHHAFYFFLFGTVWIATTVEYEGTPAPGAPPAASTPTSLWRTPPCTSTSSPASKACPRLRARLFVRSVIGYSD